jgi:hypothetical protein
MPVDLFELEQERIMAVGRINGLQRSVGDVRNKLLLLSKCEKPIRLDTKDKCGLLY